MRFLRYVLAQALFIGVLLIVIGMMFAAVRVIDRLTDNVILGVIATVIVAVIGPSSLSYLLLYTGRGERYINWYIRLAFPDRTRHP